MELNDIAFSADLEEVFLCLAQTRLVAIPEVFAKVEW